MAADIEKAIQKPLVMLTGDEDGLRRRALGQIIERATSDGDFDLQTFEAGESRPADWIGAAGTAPFISERRTVVVRHLLRADAAEAGRFSLPSYSLLVLVPDDEMGDEQRQRRLAVSRKAWEATVAASGGAVLAYNSDPRGARTHLKKEIENRGKTIGGPALDLLVEMTGGSISRGVEEIETLDLYVGEAKQITEADVRAAVVPSREWQVFRLIEAVISKNPTEALGQLRLLVVSPVRADEAAYRNVLPQMSRQFRLLWQARVCVQRGGAIEDAADCFIDNPNFAKLSDYPQRKLLAAARNTDLAAIARNLQRIADADARLKGLLPGYSAIETLERMVLEMIEAQGEPAALRG